MKSSEAPALDRRLGAQVILSFAVGYVRQDVQVCLLVGSYEFWHRPWEKQGLDLQRCCKMCPALFKAQRCNSLMVKTFIDPFCISDHLLQCRSFSWDCAFVTWWKYSLWSFFSHAPFILRRTWSWGSFMFSDIIVFALCSCWKGNSYPLLMDSKMHPF